MWTYLYRPVDSSGDTIDVMLSPKRNLTAAKLFLRQALSKLGVSRPRVINVDGHPAYPRAIADLKCLGELGQRCRCRPSPYLNILEQDHRFLKKRITASLWFRSVDGALRTIEGYEAMHMIRKGQVRWLAKDDRCRPVAIQSLRARHHCVAPSPPFQSHPPAVLILFATDPVTVQWQLDDSWLEYRQTAAGKPLQLKHPRQAVKLHRSTQEQSHDNSSF